MGLEAVFADDFHLEHVRFPLQLSLFCRRKTKMREFTITGIERYAYLVIQLPE